MITITTANLFGLAGLSFAVLAYASKSDKRLLVFNSMGSICWGINGLLLGSLAALLGSCLIAATALSTVYLPKLPKQHLLATSLFLLGLSSWYSWTDISALPTLAGSFGLIYGSLMATGLRLRLWVIFATLCFMGHSLIFSATEQTLACTFSLAVILYRAHQMQKAALPA